MAVRAHEGQIQGMKVLEKSRGNRALAGLEIDIANVLMMLQLELRMFETMMQGSRDLHGESSHVSHACFRVISE